MRSFTLSLPPLLLLCAVSFAGGESSAAVASLSADQVVDRLVLKNLERAQALNGYRSTRVYRAEYHGLFGARSAEMVVDMEYSRPDRKEFVIRSQTGSKVIIDRVFKKILESEKEAFNLENQKRIALDHDNYRFTLVDFETTPEGSRYVLAVEPKTKSKFLYRGKIWVDAEDFAVVRIMAEPAKNPSFWVRNTKIEQHYGKVGEFWLPASNRSASAIRLGGHADLSIEYKDYELGAAAPLVSGAVTRAPGAARSGH